MGVLQKPAISLAAGGKRIAVARSALIGPILGKSSVDVYASNAKIFSLWEDFCDFPIFIYPFADGKRFLCDYDDDVAMLDFVVDFNPPKITDPSLPEWPTNLELRENLERMATNIVFDTKATVRLPTYAELAEVRRYLEDPTSTPTPVKAAYLRVLYFGVNEGLLSDLASDRSSVWP